MNNLIYINININNKIVIYNLLFIICNLIGSKYKINYIYNNYIRNIL